MLNVSDTQFKTLPFEIYKLTKLFVYWNQLQTFPPEIGLLSSLEELDVSDNQLKTLPMDISKLTKLKKLFVSENQLQVVPSEINQEILFG